MKKNPSLQILIPFIIGRVEKNYSITEKQGYMKKNLYLMVLNALNENKYVNLEYHKHIVLKILVYFLTSTNLAEEDSPKDELVLRENSAKLLARLTEK